MSPIVATSTVTCTVDGVEAELDGRPTDRLAHALRAAGHVAVKVSCEEGSCGACTVLLDDAAVAACLVPLARAADRSVRTAAGADRAPVPAALVDELACRGALQCGMCTPGIVASATAFLEALDHDGLAGVDEDGVRAALAGNLCRCTGYDGLVGAVVRAAHRVAGE
ncbi:MAG: 2Fe-2S iron-sulfur cluster-binding protein [Actinomycetota bacterium]|nr:2Fe-2S iron-sulfur cluster-binding protein [Actinomycetota bacterium]